MMQGKRFARSSNLAAAAVVGKARKGFSSLLPPHGASLERGEGPGLPTQKTETKERPD